MITTTITYQNSKLIKFSSVEQGSFTFQEFMCKVYQAGTINNDINVVYRTTEDINISPNALIDGQTTATEGIYYLYALFTGKRLNPNKPIGLCKSTKKPQGTGYDYYTKINFPIYINSSGEFVSFLTSKIIDNKSEYDKAIVGSLIQSPTSVIPPFYLSCNGQSVNKTDYPELYNTLKNGGSSCIYGETTNTFKLPDYRGRFLRMIDGTAGIDPDKASRQDRGDGTTGNNVGTKQEDNFEEHYHFSFYYNSVSETGVISSSNYPVRLRDVGSNNDYTIAGGSNPPNAGRSSPAGGNETRPINIYVDIFIKAL